MFSERDQQPSPTRRRNRGLRISKSLLIVIGVAPVVGIGWWWLTQRSPTYQGNVALKRAYRSQRPLEARISGFDYAPLAQTRGAGAGEVDNVARERAERLLLDAVFNNPGPSESHALGRLYLARKEFGKASGQFTRALQAAPGDATLHNDQGVALMEETRMTAGVEESGEGIERLAIALEHFNKALNSNHKLPEAIFNRALLYQEMALIQRACEEWRYYLKLDTTSPWADEARRNLLSLEGRRQQAEQTPVQLVEGLRQAYLHNDDDQAWRIVSQHRDRTGSIAVRELLNNYLDALAKKDLAESKRLVDALAYVGAMEKRRTGDRYTGDLAAFYRRATPGQLEAMRKARSWLQSGVEQLYKLSIEDAKELFTQARSFFYRAGNAGEALHAEALLARCYRKQAELPMRLGMYERLSRACARAGYEWLLTQILTAQAQIQDGLANYSNVIEYTRRGLRSARQDNNTSAEFLLQAAVAHYNLGDYHQSLRFCREGLTLINLHPATPYTRWATNTLVALPLNALGRHDAAAEFQQESLRVARAFNNTGQTTLSHINLAVTYGYQRRYQEATSNAQAAFETAQGIPIGVFRTEHMALASLRLGQLRSQMGDFAAAIEHFDQAIEFYQGLNTQQAFEYESHKGKLVNAIAQGGHPSLEIEIGNVLRLFEEYRVKIREESDRNRFFDLEQSIYDIAIDYWHERKHDKEAAFELAERSRARSLLDLVSNAPGQVRQAAEADLQPKQVTPPLTLTQIRARLPEQSQIVEYAVLKDRLLIWLVSRAQPLVSKELPISAAALGDRVTTYLQLVAKGPTRDQTAMTEAALQLYDLLIQPIAPFLDRRKQLCLAPDKMLNQLPYAALISPQSGRFLIEDYSLILAPSATMFITCSDAAAQKEGVKAERLLIVGDPAFDRKIFALPRLPSARQEARAIANYYRQPQTLVGEQATKRLLMKSINQFDVLHLALHCVVDARSPMRSKLLLAAPDKEEDEAVEAEGVLQAHEIYDLPLSRLRLVVLAACRSGVERYYGGEGMVGVSRPFIAKGIPLVVASLWEVDSPATTELMTRFHEYRKLKSLPTVEALRQAQLSLLHDSGADYRQPYHWAAFAGIGGYSRF